MDGPACFGASSLRTAITLHGKWLVSFVTHMLGSQQLDPRKASRLVTIYPKTLAAFANAATMF
jgi:hypothetical protein